MSKDLKYEAVNKEVAAKNLQTQSSVSKNVKKNGAVGKAPVRKKARPAREIQEARKRAESAPKRMPETILPPPEELVTEYKERWDDGEAILHGMDEYKAEGHDEEDTRNYFEGDIEEWGRERDALFDLAEKVWLGLHPDTDPSWGDLDDWLGGDKLYMELA